MAPNCAVADVDEGRCAHDVRRSGDLSDAQRRGAIARACRSKRSACSTTPARTPTAAAATATPRKRRPSCRRKSASRCGCSSAARTNSAGTTTALRFCPICARPSTPTASSSPSSIRRGATPDGGLDTASQLALGRRRRPAASAAAVRSRRCRALFGPLVADGHVRRPESPDRQSPRRRRRVSANRRAARADGPVDVLRAGRDDGRARARGQAGSVRVPQAQHLAPALARRARGGDRCREVDAARRGVATCRARESSPAAALASARTTCRRTRAIASPTRRPWWTSR